MATVAVFAAAFTFGAVFTVPANGNLPCRNNCDRVRALLGGAFVCFVTSLFLIIVIHLYLGNAKADKPIQDFWQLLLVLWFLAYCFVGILVGFIVLSVVLILNGQVVAGSLTIVVLSLFSLVFCFFWLQQYLIGTYHHPRSTDSRKTWKWSWRLLAYIPADASLRRGHVIH
jgi:hypothetical protein